MAARLSLVTRGIRYQRLTIEINAKLKIKKVHFDIVCEAVVQFASVEVVIQIAGKVESTKLIILRWGFSLRISFMQQGNFQ